MTKVAVYSVQPVLLAGAEAIFGQAGGFELTTATASLPELLAHLGASRPSVALVEASPEITLQALHQLNSSTGVPVVLWVDTVPVEFVSQAIALGVRGVVRKTMSVVDVLACVRKVAEGQLWVEKDLCDRLLCTRRVALTPRERQLLVLLAQGLKNKEIAWSLQITEGTVKVYLSRLFQKVGANDRFDLAIFALKNFTATREGLPTQIPPHAAAGNPAVPQFLPSFVSFSRQVQ